MVSLPSPPSPTSVPPPQRANGSLARKGQQGADWKSAFQTGLWSLSVFLPVLICSVDARHQRPPPAPGDALWGTGAPLRPAVQETGRSHCRLISNKRQDPQRAGMGRAAAEQGRPVGTWSTCRRQLPVQQGPGLQGPLTTVGSSVGVHAPLAPRHLVGGRPGQMCTSPGAGAGLLQGGEEARPQGVRALPGRALPVSLSSPPPTTA